MSILSTIVEYKKKELESTRDLIQVSDLQKLPFYHRDTFSMVNSLRNRENTGIIAEFKRKSPSKGIINEISRVDDVVEGYARHKASAISVLTDFNFFGGSVDDLKLARNVTSLPLLRKEFILDEYQLHEAKAMGGDVILLIAAILSPAEVKELAHVAHDLGLEVLLEIHNEEELEAISDDVDIVGVNNRNLKTFEVDLQHSVDLAMKIPDQFLKISESGIASIQDIEYLRQHNFEGFLIGENFMKTPDPVAAFAVFIESMKLGGLA